MGDNCGLPVFTQGASQTTFYDIHYISDCSLIRTCQIFLV